MKPVAPRRMVCFSPTPHPTVAPPFFFFRNFLNSYTSSISFLILGSLFQNYLNIIKLLYTAWRHIWFYCFVLRVSSILGVNNFLLIGFIIQTIRMILFTHYFFEHFQRRFIRPTKGSHRIITTFISMYIFCLYPVPTFHFCFTTVA